MDLIELDKGAGLEAEKMLLLYKLLSTELQGSALMIHKEEERAVEDQYKKIRIDYEYVQVSTILSSLSQVI